MKDIAIIVGISLIVVVGIVKLHESKSKLPPRWVDVCVDGYEEMHLVPIVMNNSIIFQPQVRHICTKYEKQCKAGEKYNGPVKECK